ncbi:hypothetical protein H8S20_17695 [Clostridium sp. NSJ-6]|uniref:DHHW protein n=1 Tax=Clostridium hominis TaxID=2763036 RepID=A0ABR7DH05_9CLOT|nr:DHHW family protein [Clostridium hominis]MBC5630689.1 hypothetical protein [Clostridium hominis]MDU2670471.1 DHHW family protein [Clostridium sp.]
MENQKIDYNSKTKKQNKGKFKRNNKALNILMSLIFTGFIVIVILFNLLKVDKAFSEEENRPLATMPKFTIKSFLSGEFTEEYTKYVEDNFAGKKGFISIKSNLEKLEGKNESNSIFIGKDGQLLQSFKEGSEEETNAKIAAINSFYERHSNLNTSFMLTPTATKVLEEKLPKYAPNDDELDYINNIFSGLNNKINTINPYEALNENKDEYIFYKTDHHWTSKGAYIAYTAMCESLGLTPSPINEFDVVTVTNSFYGSLSSKVGIKGKKADSIDVYIPKESDFVVNYVNEQRKSTSLFDSTYLDKKDKYEVFTGGNHPLINIKTLGDPNKRLLIIKDSFANCFLPFLTAHYGEINVVDLRYYYDDLDKLIENREITDVLFLYNANTFNSDDSILNIEN